MVFIVICEMRYFNKDGLMTDCHTQIANVFGTESSANSFIDLKKIELEQEHKNDKVVSMYWYAGEDYAITFEVRNKCNYRGTETVTVEYYLTHEEVVP